MDPLRAERWRIAARGGEPCSMPVPHRRPDQCKCMNVQPAQVVAATWRSAAAHASRCACTLQRP